VGSSSADDVAVTNENLQHDHKAGDAAGALEDFGSEALPTIQLQTRVKAQPDRVRWKCRKS
jgi:hypothetical protein